MEDVSQDVSRPAGDPIPRPSSTSAAEAAVSQLLGMTSGLPEGHGNEEPTHDPSLTHAPPAQDEMEQQPQSHTDEQQHQQQQQQQHQEPQPHPQQQPEQHHPQPTPTYNGATPAATAGGNGNGLPTCQNCSTSTTPLWRRDEYGSVLCNACGLFLKLHGRPRPISLKTDVIKSRNRVKTMRPDMQGKKKTTTPMQNSSQGRKPTANMNPDGTNESPISRTGTPSMYSNQALPAFMMEDPYSGTGFGANGDNSASSMNGDAPQTHEQLIATNSSLKTRVRELELINELFRSRLNQLEQQEAAARRGTEVAGAEQSQLRSQLEDSHRRENSLKRRLDEMEVELKEAREAQHDDSDRAVKKQRFVSPVPEQPVDDSPAVSEESREPVAPEAADAPEAPVDPEVQPDTTVEADA